MECDRIVQSLDLAAVGAHPSRSVRRLRPAIGTGPGRGEPVSARGDSAMTLALPELSATAVDAETVLAPARAAARTGQLACAGALPPADAWTLFATGQAVLVDVRTVEERAYVGRVPGSLHVAWATGTAQTRNPRFLRELEKCVPHKDAVVLLLCRSGKRSAAAAAAATAAGYTQVYNVLEGFEGERDTLGRRGDNGGWRHHGLPWE